MDRPKVPVDLPEFPAWLVFDAMAEPDGLMTPAFQKMYAAMLAWSDNARAMTKAFEAEYLEHHKGEGDTLTPPCAAATAAIPKYRKSRRASELPK